MSLPTGPLFDIGASAPEPSPRPKVQPFSGLPATPALLRLRALPHWVPWVYRLKYPPDKPDGTPRPPKWIKLPIDPRSGGGASVADPATWMGYEDAATYAINNGCDGVGFVLTADDGFGGGDLDGVFDEEGVLAPWAAEVLDLRETYAEKSPSGRGVRLFWLGKPDRANACMQAGTEIYGTGRFLTLTGDILPGAPDDIHPAPETSSRLGTRIAEHKARIAEELRAKREAEGTPKAKLRRQRAGGAAPNFFEAVNEAAYADFSAWVPILFVGNATPTALKGWRVSSDALARDLEEDLSISPQGIKDFGVADLGDPKEGKRSPIDLVAEWGMHFDHFPETPTPVQAAFWLCLHLSLAPEALGWGKNDVAIQHFDADAAPPGAKPPGPKQVIRIKMGNTEEVVDAIEEALIKRGGLFQRSNRIVFVGEEPMAIRNGRNTGIQRIMERGDATLMEDVERVATLLQFDGRSKKEVPVRPSPLLVKTLQQRRGQFRLPFLAAIVNAPTLRPDGSVLSVPGYDAGTGLLFDSRGAVFPEIPRAPSRDDALRALASLSELLAGFPFEGEADRSVALSGILTATTRSAFPTAPMHCYSATTPGSGKGKLVDIAAALATGREAGVTAQSANSEEMEKQIASLLLSGAPVIALDNCSHPVDGNLLCTAMVQPVVTLRPFGKLETCEVPCAAFWTATGNSLVIAGDMTRRALLCRIDPKMERPELREFAFEPVAKAKAERGRYLVDALTILLAFQTAGSPRQTKPLGSFEAWSLLVRDALIWLGCADPVATMDDARRKDPKLHRLNAVMQQWLAALGTDVSTAGEVVYLAKGMRATGGAVAGDFYEALSAVAGYRGDVDPGRLGSWLGRQKGRVLGGMRFESDVHRKGIATWRLSTLDGERSASDDGP